MAGTYLWWQARGGWRPEDEELCARVRARTDCGGCGLPQVVENGVCVDCKWKDPKGKEKRNAPLP